MQKTSIEWTHRPGTVGMTWNPIRAKLKGQGPKVRTGTFCTKISPGCTNCYASVINKRFGTGLAFTVPNLEQHEFVLDERFLAQPIQQKKPATIFVGDMFDLWHEAIPAEMIAEVLRVALKTPRHTFQFLTKRAERMQRTVNFAQEHWGVNFGEHMWFGVSVEDQQRADERIPQLLQTTAVVRFLSVEPLLEAVDLSSLISIPDAERSCSICGIIEAPESESLWDEHECPAAFGCRRLDWVICGGESGPGARPMHPAWARSLRDQCAAANVAFFFKQWGEWQPHQEPPDRNGAYHGGVFLLSNGQLGKQGDWWEGRAQAMDRVGKKKAGARLDGHLWREFPASKKAEAVPA